MLGIHAASGTLYSLFVLQYSSVYMDQLELVFRLLVRLQFMYFQYNVYLSIVVRTNIVFFIYTHMIQNNLRTPQLAGFARQLGCNNRSQSHCTYPLKVMDPRYPVPRPRKLSTEINKLFMMMKVAIKEHVTSATAVHFTTYGAKRVIVIIPWYNHTLLFPLQQPIPLSAVSCEIYIMELHHTAGNVAAIFMEVLKEWKIPPEKDGFVITNNGSNVVKAFQQD